MNKEGQLAWKANVRERRAVERWRPARRWYHPLLVSLVIATSKLITTRLNELTIDGLERFEAAQRLRSGRGLLTFSNHVSMFDDPLLVANIAPNRYEDIRWVASDALNFFGSGVKAWFFTAGKCVPIVRGTGVDQPGYHFLRGRLRDGDWVHIFPEGGRTRDPDALMTPPFRKGIGRLIAEVLPVTLPFYHYGMHAVLPPGARLPRRGYPIQLGFGEPVLWTQELVREVSRTNAEGETLREPLTSWTYEELRRLELAIHPRARMEGNGP